VGYSPLRNFVGTGFFERSDTLHGWNASLLTKVNPWLGVAVDFGGHYNGRTSGIVFPAGSPVPSRSDFKYHSGLAGPQVTLQHGRFKPFARALFGASRLSYVSFEPADSPRSAARPTVDSTGHLGRFTWGAGAGLDWQAFESVKIRLIQADYLKSGSGVWGLRAVASESLRTSFGVVIPF
jgi:hypothetical protein